MRAWVDLLHGSPATRLWAGIPARRLARPGGAADKPARRRSTRHRRDRLLRARHCAFADAAALLGDDADAATYARARGRSRAAFSREYVTPAGDGERYADGVRARARCSTWWRRRQRGRSPTAWRLVRAGGYRIGTGFVGTPLVTDALTARRHVDVAARLLLETECPSWLYPVTMGATTVWERWDSLLPDGIVNPGEMTRSTTTPWAPSPTGCIAPSPGSRPTPGLRRSASPRARSADSTRVRAAPDAVRARHPSHGAGTGSPMHRRAVVPPNTTAVVDLPGRDGADSRWDRGRHEWSVADRRSNRARGACRLDSATRLGDRRPARLPRAVSTQLAADDHGGPTPAGGDALERRSHPRPGTHVHPAPTARARRCGRSPAISGKARNPMLDRSSTFGEALDSPAARSVLESVSSRRRRLADGVAIQRRATRPR